MKLPHDQDRALAIVADKAPVFVHFTRFVRFLWRICRDVHFVNVSILFPGFFGFIRGSIKHITDQIAALPTMACPGFCYYDALMKQENSLNSG
jgi:hypothetical protein